MEHTPVDLTKLRYVLYARKSTEDDGRQVRSIGDQIKDCKKLAKELGLHVVDEIIEHKSAKKPDQRPLFTKMLADIKARKYDAIICWHPDRLCRNMLEGGQIINMLDENELVDIRFHSHQFSNDANGKMLLGMLFVFSKQYSDDLSAKVSRGVQGNLLEGKSSGAPKFGYDRDQISGHYVPNEFFDLVKESWSLREAGQSYANITKFLNDNGYQRSTRDAKRQRIIKASENSISNMFRDPFYFGLLVQVNQEVDLRTIYNFVPMISEETYRDVQIMSRGRTKDNYPKKRATFYPLRGMVYCAVCKDNKYMQVGRNRSRSGKSFLTYRCDNKLCDRRPKSFRAKHIFNYLYDLLSDIKMTDEAYERYSKRLNTLTDSKIIDIKQLLRSKNVILTNIKKDIEFRALKIVDYEKGSTIYKTNEQKIAELTSDQLELESEISGLEAKIKNPQQIKVTKEEFLNLLKTASRKMKAGSPVEKDALTRILFLNLRVDNEKVVSHLWREPFSELIQVIESTSGRGDRT